ncbi:MAG: hypothetical protein U0787_21000 [Polyangia bacterium]
MQDTIARYGEPKNEPVFGYLPGSAERNALKAELAKMGGASVDVPLYIGGEQVRTGRTRNIVTPHSHRRSLGVFHRGGSSHVEQAIAQALAAQADWAALPWQQRAVNLKAADLLSGPWRMRLNGDDAGAKQDLLPSRN